MRNFFRRLFTKQDEPEETVEIPAIIEQIKQREQARDIPPGRRIHSFSYKIFQLSLDRDITENYRVTVYQGRERIYSFTIFANQGNYDILERTYFRIIAYLDGDQDIAELSDDDNLKGFFYGH